MLLPVTIQWQLILYISDQTDQIYIVLISEIISILMRNAMNIILKLLCEVHDHKTIKCVFSFWNIWLHFTNNYNDYNKH